MNLFNEAGMLHTNFYESWLIKKCEIEVGGNKVKESVDKTGTLIRTQIDKINLKHKMSKKT